MKLRYSARTEYDLDRIFQYIRLHSHSTSAEKVAADIKQAFKRVRQMPRSGRLQQDGISRKIVSPKYKYLIFYTQESARTIEILTVRSPSTDHGFRDA